MAAQDPADVSTEVPTPDTSVYQMYYPGTVQMMLLDILTPEERLEREQILDPNYTIKPGRLQTTQELAERYFRRSKG